MKKLVPMFHHNGMRGMAVLWRLLGRPLATIAGAILVATIVVQGESWAIRQAPLLLTARSIALAPDAECLPADSADDAALPVAILH